MNIKPITIKPIKPAAAAPAAPAAETPAAAPAPAAPAAPPAGIRPIAIRPAAPAASEAPAAAPAGGGAAAGARPIVIQPAPAAGKPLSSAPSTTTIRLKPVAPPPTVPAPKVEAAPVPMRPTVIAAPPARPAPLPTPAAAQAMKGKTSRISLDDALASAPSATGPAAMGKLTSNLSATAAAMGKLTSNLSAAAIAAAKSRTAKVSVTILDTDPAASHPTLRMKAPVAPPSPAAPAEAAPAPAEPADDSEAPTIRRKTLVLKKDDGGEDGKPTLRIKAGGPPVAGGAKGGLKLKGRPAPGTSAPPAADGSAAAPADASADQPAAPAAVGSAFNPMAVARKEKVNVAFPILAVASLFIVIGLCLLFMSQACGPDRSRYINFSSFPGWPEFGCPGASRVVLD